MATKHIQIDISSNIFDNVIAFLEKSTKSKVKLNIVQNSQKLLKNKPSHMLKKLCNEWKE